MTVGEARRGLRKARGEENGWKWPAAVCLLLGSAFLGGPLLAHPATAMAQSPEVSNVTVEFQTDAGQSAQEQAQRKQEAEQAARDREQERRDREQELRDREQEKKDQEQERVDRLQELYDDGRGYLDEEDYGDAEKKFSELAALNGPQTDAALYWKAYSQNKQGKREAALATTGELKRKFPQSRWKKDAEALEIEMKQRSGGTVNPDTQSDQDLKFLALQGIMNNDPERGIPLIAKYLDGPGSPKDKGKALFVLAQSGSPQAQETLKKIALGQSNPELQRKAVEYLGIFGGKGNAGTLAEVYKASNDAEVKRSVIRGYMISGDREHLLALAKGEKDEGLKREAIRNLGISGGAR